MVSVYIHIHIIYYIHIHINLYMCIQPQCLAYNNHGCWIFEITPSNIRWTVWLKHVETFVLSSSMKASKLQVLLQSWKWNMMQHGILSRFLYNYGHMPLNHGRVDLKGVFIDIHG